MSKSSVPSVLSSKTLKLYKNKKLNSANFGNFTLNDYQVFLHLISKIGGVDEFGKYLQPEELQREYVLTAKEFSDVFKVDMQTCYRILKKAVDKLMKTDIRVQSVDGSGFRRINICSMAEYKLREGSIIISFTEHIMPYLAQVKQRFVLYNLKEIANFGSLHTTRLYELIQEFQETGWVLKSVEQLREVFAVGNALKRYGDFKKYTFSHACQEINDNYDMGLRFEELKEGRKVVAVKFFFKQTVINQITNQKTGKITNVYCKPKTQTKTRNKVKQASLATSSEALEDQASFMELKTEAKPMKSILSSILSKFTSFKK